MEPFVNTGSLSGRPGGFALTDKVLQACNLKAGARIIDLGCGSGKTVEFLTTNYGFDAVGLEIDPCACLPGNKLILGSATAIPFLSGTFDGILMECSFSLMKNGPGVLEECNRVLKPRGCLLITDMYARGTPADLGGFLGYLAKKEDIITQVEEHRFSVEIFEDCSHDLQTLWGQMIFDQGSEEFYHGLGVTKEVLKKINCGYYFMKAVKRYNPEK